MSLLLPDEVRRSQVRLLPLMADFFAMKPEDVEQLADDLFTDAQSTWFYTLQEQATLYGCGRSRKQPRLGEQDEQYLKQMCLTDARSIAQTFNQDVVKELNKQFQANPRSNRFAYLERIQAWSTSRYEWKSKQIAIQIIQKTRTYTKQRFADENALEPVGYIYVGPPPVSDICKARTAAGVVSKEYADANPTPAHAGPCIHEWEAAAKRRINCATMWLG